MSEQDRFESRLHAAVRAYAGEVVSELDPASFAHRLATTAPARRSAWRGWIADLAPSGGLAWALLAAAVLATAVGIIGVATLLRPAPHVPPPWGLARPGLMAFDNRDGHIILTDADGSHPRDISGAAGGDHLPVWSPDGTRLAFWRATGDHLSIVVTDPAGGATAIIATNAPVPADPGATYAGGAPGQLDWAPDSRRIAFWQYVGEMPQIFVVSSDGSGLHRIGDPAIPAVDPEWSPDGSRIVFAAVADQLVGLHGAAPDANGVFVMHADGSGARRISGATGHFPNGPFHQPPQWQPGGDLIAFSTDADGISPHVFVVRSDGTGERDVSLQVPGQIFLDSSPSWSPDGRRLAFWRWRADLFRLQAIIVDADGGEPLALDLPEGVTVLSLTWAPDGSRLLAYAIDRATGIASGVIDVDLTGSRPVRLIPVTFDQLGSWQRLAP